MNLKDFEENHKTNKAPQCTVCMLSASILTELHAAEERGTSRPVMARYLQDVHGSRIQSFTLGDHFRKGHHTRGTR